MAALNYKHRLQPREDVSGRKFSIIFGVVAFFIVAGCLFWGFSLPRYRKKHHSRPSPTRYNDHMHDQFPSHPALLRGFRKQRSGNLRQYDPRTQTPFPNTPPPGDSISLPSLTPQKQNANGTRSTNEFGSVLTPARDRLPSRRGLTAYMEAKASSPDDRRQLASYFDIDEILPVPEPVTLRPRSAGRAPTLGRHLSRFPLPRSESASSGNLAHPRKLFGDLEQRYSKSTTITSLGTPSPLPLSTKYQKELKKQTKSECAKEQDGPNNSTNELVATVCKTATGQAKSGAQTANSSESTKQPGIARAGTVTRTETSVAETRSLHDEKARVRIMKGEGSYRSATLSSIELPSTSTVSDYAGLATPPTSPIAHSELPTLSKCIEAEQTCVKTASAPDRTWSRATTNSSTALPVTDRLAPMHTILEGRKDESRQGGEIGSSRLVRSRPVRLDLTFNTRPASLFKRAQRHSMSSLSSLLLPLNRSKRPSVQASSVYSRDTRGVSIIRSPLSPSFGEEAAGGQLEDSFVKPVQAKSSSLDLLRHKIDNWDLHTAYIDFSTSPSSTLKRALSDFGPRSPTFPAPTPISADAMGEASHTGIPPKIPKICIGRPSDDIFRDPSPNIESGRVLKRVLDMEVAASLANLTRSPSTRRAPGGADWI